MQAWLLRSQSINGARSIFPAYLQPEKYDYFVKFDPAKSQTDRDQLSLATGPSESGQPAMEWEEAICPICLESVYTPAHEELLASVSQNPYFRQIATRKNEYMKAPCRHIFHIVCLLNWMDVKLECPSCRCPLPPV